MSVSRSSCGCRCEQRPFKSGRIRSGHCLRHFFILSVLLLTWSLAGSGQTDEAPPKKQHAATSSSSGHKTSSQAHTSSSHTKTTGHSTGKSKHSAHHPLSARHWPRAASCTRRLWRRPNCGRWPNNLPRCAVRRLMPESPLMPSPIQAKPPRRLTWLWGMRILRTRNIPRR